MAIVQSPLATFAMLAIAVAACWNSAEAHAQAVASPADGCPAVGETDAASGAPSVKPVRQPGDWAWLCRYREENRLVHRKDAPSVVLIGDSITEHWPASGPQAFDKTWVGRGIGGQTSSQILLRFYQDAIALKPQVIHLLVGGNDVARNAGSLDTQSYQGNVRAMVDLACANKITVVLGTILPADRFYWRKEIRPVDEIRSLNRWLEEFAAVQRIRLVDYYTPMATPDGAMRADLSDDGVHPNKLGYEVMRRALESTMSDALADHRSRKRSNCRIH